VEKSLIIQTLKDAALANYQRMLDAAKDTSAAATDPESKAEGKYDTRGLEASYLAAGQGEQVAALAEALQSLEPSAFPPFPADSEIAPGALVETESDGEKSYFLLAPKGGGLSSEHSGCEVTILTPEAPLRQKLLGLKAGDRIDRPDLKITRVL
jgi:hypothetical protein